MTMEISRMSEALQLHAQIIKSPNHLNNNNEAVDSKLFTFNTILRAYSRSPDPSNALRLFSTSAAAADKYTFPSLFKACSRLRDASSGHQLHALALKSGLASDRWVSHAIIQFYSITGHSKLARQTFDQMPHTDVVSWTLMIAGYVHDNNASEAVRLFGDMNIHPNDVTFVTVLKACAEAGALGVGQKVNAMVNGSDYRLSPKVAVALIDMYAKCGCLEGAERVFNSLVDDNVDNVFAWTAMISGLATHGMFEEAIELFERMGTRDSGLKPDSKTMTAVLSACRNAGRAREARELLETMEARFGVRPAVQHYGCVADLLARAGRLGEAEEFVGNMPVEPDAALWRNLVWACKAHGDMDRAERLMRQLGSDCDSGSFVLMGNVYASVGKWAEKARSRRRMTDLGLAKPPGTSRIEIDGEIHSFVAGDWSHPDSSEIYQKLREAAERAAREGGYRPRLSEVLLDSGDGEKADQLSRHSEKLALAYALVRTEPGQPIRIVKNLRSCVDCHEFMKCVSRVYAREIVVRDRIRFHHFSSGSCSCNDCW